MFGSSPKVELDHFLVIRYCFAPIFGERESMLQKYRNLDFRAFWFISFAKV